MVRAQSENRPNIPHSFDELSEVLMHNPELSRTLDGMMELYQGMVGAEGHRSIVFMSRRVVDAVMNIRVIFCDATFYARPNSPNSSQLFTIVIVRDNHVRCLLFFVTLNFCPKPVLTWHPILFAGGTSMSCANGIKNN
jgi:hypothetical protein